MAAFLKIVVDDVVLSAHQEKDGVVWKSKDDPIMAESFTTSFPLVPSNTTIDPVDELVEVLQRDWEVRVLQDNRPRQKPETIH